MYSCIVMPSYRTSFSYKNYSPFSLPIIYRYITSSMYSFLWDVLIDWGLGDIKHGFLCEHRMYSRKSFYYVAIALDLILRFNWVYSLVPPGFIPLVNFPTYITTIVLLLEFARRTMWGVRIVVCMLLHPCWCTYYQVANIPLLIYLLFVFYCSTFRSYFD